MKKVTAIIIAIALVLTLIPIGGLVASATTLNVTFAAGGSYNGGTMNITYATSDLVRGTEYEFAFYDDNDDIISDPVAENRQWFGLKCSATDYGTVQVDSTNTWWPMWNYNSGAVGTIIMIPMTYMFKGATKIEIREKATPANTTGLLAINTSLISDGNSNTSFSATQCLPSSIAGCIKAQKNAPRWNPGTVWYYKLTSTGASIPSADVKADGALMMIKGSGHNTDASINVDIYLTHPSYAYINIANSIGTRVQSPALSTAQLNGLTPATPSYISIEASTAGYFKVSGLLPLTYEIIQDDSANTPASWAGATDLFNGQGTSADILKTGDYLHIRTKAGTKITNNSSCYNASLAGITEISIINASENAADPLSFIASGEQQQFTVTTTGTINAQHPITLNINKPEEATWLTVSQSAGSYSTAGNITVTVTASNNPGVARNTNLTLSFTADDGYYLLPNNLNVAISQEASPSQDELAAFPGAEGYGKYAVGGRGGDVYYVTNLNNDGAGSLRYGITSAVNGARTIVFAIGGIINLTSQLKILKENITIAGQTAPGGGITIKNYGLTIQADDTIVRYIRARVGDLYLANVDGISIGSGQNVIVDHCSVSWCMDESLSISYWSSGSDYTTLDKVSVQWCFITEPCDHNPDYDGGTRAGKGTLINMYGGAGLSMHHNLYASVSDRAPRIGSYKTYAQDPIGPQVDFRNNVIFNCDTFRPGYTSGNDHARTYSFVNNYYKPGADTPVGPTYICEEYSPYGNAYASGNNINGTIVEGATNLFKNWSGVATWLANEPDYSEFAVTTETAANAYNSVLADAGASLVRDSVDTRIVSEVQNGTGQIIEDQNEVGGWPNLSAGSAPTDTDSDGMPDSFETANGLNNNNAGDRNNYDLSEEYTNLEVYLNSLVA